MNATSTSTSSGWNRGTSTPKPAPKKPSPIRGIVAGLVVVALGAGIVAWLFKSGEAESLPLQEKKPARIKEVTPAHAPTNAVQAAATPKKDRKNWREDEIKALEERYGDNMPRDIKSYYYSLKNPVKRTFRPKMPYGYLRHPSERVIAEVLQIEPGTEFVIKPEYGENFNQDFVNALLDKIEINPDDDEETRGVKEFVTNAKKEIAALVKKEGKKPNELLNEHVAALYELGKYQQNLNAMLREANNNPNMTDADVQDYVRAANKMREEKGLAPIKVPSLRGRARRLEHLQRIKDKKQNKEH